jgi:cytochrome c6
MQNGNFFFNLLILIGIIHMEIANDTLLSRDFNIGKQLFIENCNSCHISGQNLILPEKNLKREVLKANGMNSLNAIVYQITNGKNGMPAFGGRLSEKEIREIANYVLNEVK